MASVASSPLLQRAHEIAAEFDYPAEQVNAGVAEFLRLLDSGLNNENQPMTMIPTYVTSVPNGTEKGVYLAVDLGGTNFRVCSITLHGNSQFTLTQAKSAIPKELMTGTSHELFSFLARKVADFVSEHHSEHFAEDSEHHLRLGFTFSFPVDQKGINKGYLIRWTKGFDIKDAIGQDVCELLQREIDALKLPVVVAALVNDTVGTLMARSYTSPGKTGTLLGAIFGTGTNGAYVEKLHRIGKMTATEEARAAYGNYDTSTGEMVINTEWGSFDNALNVLPNTSYDQALDRNSVNPGIQMFEKRVSGMFLGEILRNAILKLKDEAGLFSPREGSNTTIHENANVYRPWTIDTSFLSLVEADTSPNLQISRELMETELGVTGASEEDAEAVRIVSRAIGRRSARLSAVPIAAIIISTKLREEASKVDEGVDVSLDQDRKSVEVDVGGDQQADPKIDDDLFDDRPLLTHVYDGFHSAWQWLRNKFTRKTAPIVDAPPSGSTSGKMVSGCEDQIIDLGVDGSVVEYYPSFERYLREALVDVKEIGEKVEKRVRIGVAKDGSGVGAALIALVASL
ncbi:putative glucokinase GlkA [Kalaharituber pfeilii]|nr:putative glucokinase GlkA [Kalaharituber pfeilii]